MKTSLCISRIKKEGRNRVDFRVRQCGRDKFIQALLPFAYIKNTSMAFWLLVYNMFGQVLCPDTSPSVGEDYELSRMSDSQTFILL